MDLGTSMINFVFTEPRINSVAVKANISEKETKNDMKIIVILILNELGKSRREGDQGTSRQYLYLGATLGTKASVP